MAKSTRKTRSGTRRQSLADKNQLRSKPLLIALAIFSAGVCLIGLAVIFQNSSPEPAAEAPFSANPDFHQEKVVFWEKIISRYPDYPDAYLQLAKLSLEKGETEKAIRYRQLAAQLAPNHPGLDEINLEISF